MSIDFHVIIKAAVFFSVYISIENDPYMTVN